MNIHHAATSCHAALCVMLLLNIIMSRCHHIM